MQKTIRPKIKIIDKSNIKYSGRMPKFNTLNVRNSKIKAPTTKYKTIKSLFISDFTIEIIITLKTKIVKNLFKFKKTID